MCAYLRGTHCGSVGRLYTCKSFQLLKVHVLLYTCSTGNDLTYICVQSAALKGISALTQRLQSGKMLSVILTASR